MKSMPLEEIANIDEEGCFNEIIICIEPYTVAMHNILDIQLWFR